MEQEKILSKFNSLAELEKAYVNLESEFTKRCKTLKDLQAENESLRSSVTATTEKSTISNQDNEGEKPTYSQTFESEPDLEGIVKNNSFKLFGKGESVITPPKKPRTLAEANDMAKNFLKGDNNF